MSLIREFDVSMAILFEKHVFRKLNVFVFASVGRSVCTCYDHFPFVFLLVDSHYF